MDCRLARTVVWGGRDRQSLVVVGWWHLWHRHRVLGPCWTRAQTYALAGALAPQGQLCVDGPVEDQIRGTVIIIITVMVVVDAATALAVVLVDVIQVG